MNRDDFGDRMKGYEAVETDRRLDTSLPVYARIDGRGFSKFTKGMNRPYDERMSLCMIGATKHLVEQTHAKIGYTQSDEISLLWNLDGSNPKEQMFFDGKVQKLVSVLAGMATAAFMKQVLDHEDSSFSAYADKLPHFDARVFNLPSEQEAANSLLWREQDAERNAVSMAAQHYFSHKELQFKSKREMLLMLDQKGVKFHEYPRFFTNGTFLRRETIEKCLSAEEWCAIPEKHRQEQDCLVTRSEVREMEINEPFVNVVNRVGVALHGSNPVYAFKRS